MLTHPIRPISIVSNVDISAINGSVPTVVLPFSGLLLQYLIYFRSVNGSVMPA